RVEHQRLGLVLEPAGDGDGRADLLAGLSALRVPQRPLVGAAVYRWSSGSLTRWGAWYARTIEEGSRCGEIAASMGATDVDGDGRSDVVLAERDADASAQGCADPTPRHEQALVFRGGSTPRSAAPDWVLDAASGRAGRSVAVGDFDGDGLGDVAVGVVDGGVDRLETFAGRATGPVAVRAFDGQNTPRGAVTDLDGDGYDDLVTSGGLVHVGGAAGLAATPDEALVTGPSGAPLRDVRAVGDLNGDGFGDLAGMGTGLDEGLLVVRYGAPPDLDGDGFSSVDDCDDADAAAGARAPWWPDADGDGYGDRAVELWTCAPPPGAVAVGGDCDDADPSVRPGADERATLDVDLDCDGLRRCATDADHDGHGALPVASVAWAPCGSHGGWAADLADCDDANRFAWTLGGQDVPGEGVDRDCDGLSTCWVDLDGDGHGAAVTVPVAGSCDASGASRVSDDCDDHDAAISPGAPEVLEDGVDQDCDGRDRVTLEVGTPAPAAPLDLAISGVPAPARVVVVGSVAGPGPGPCHAALSGRCLGVLQPRALADVAVAGPPGSRTITLSLTPPAALAGRAVWLQAVAVSGGAAWLSDPVAVRLAP
ncbi:MAG TPA: putative metal-binding motif-containing protein, partial [Myxococcota bacterium]|nr:putative metal-binding motif-containing protein [Myxococcota bacterium]